MTRDDKSRVTKFDGDTDSAVREVSANDSVVVCGKFSCLDFRLEFHKDSPFLAANGESAAPLSRSCLTGNGCRRHCHNPKSGERVQSYPENSLHRVLKLRVGNGGNMKVF